MQKKDKIFIIWIAVYTLLSMLCMISGCIIIGFNEPVGFAFCLSGIYAMLLCVKVPCIIWIINKLMKGED